jgi:hypothetical protein
LIEPRKSDKRFVRRDEKGEFQEDALSKGNCRSNGRLGWMDEHRDGEQADLVQNTLEAHRGGRGHAHDEQLNRWAVTRDRELFLQFLVSMALAGVVQAFRREERLDEWCHLSGWLSGGHHGHSFLFRAAIIGSDEL